MPTARGTKLPPNRPPPRLFTRTPSPMTIRSTAATYELDLRACFGCISMTVTSTPHRPRSSAVAKETTGPRSPGRNDREMPMVPGNSCRSTLLPGVLLRAGWAKEDRTMLRKLDRIAIVVVSGLVGLQAIIPGWQIMTDGSVYGFKLPADWLT